MKKSKKFAIITIGTAILSACSSPIKVDERSATGHALAAQNVNGATMDSRPVKAGGTGLTDPLKDANGALAARSVYFSYDSFAVNSDGKQVVENHSAYLNKNKGRAILIQGNTDDRGGTEYNLALGQKRAEAVRKAMLSLGVASHQMEAVSLGEEKPKNTGTTDAAHAENRRVDIVY